MAQGVGMSVSADEKCADEWEWGRDLFLEGGRGLGGVAVEAQAD